MNNSLFESDFSVLSQISGQPQISQRELSKRSGISLGAVNLILGRLIKKGWIKTRTLNGRTLQYLLTPRGLEEKLKKTCAFVERTYRQARQFETGVRSALERIDFSPYNGVDVLGENEIATLVLGLLSERGIPVFRIQSPSDCRENRLFLNATSRISKTGNEIPLLALLPQFFFH